LTYFIPENVGKGNLNHEVATLLRRPAMTDV
jgi:hypothetical protein